MKATDSVNYIRHLSHFYTHVRKDNRLKGNDISLYHALFQIWNDHHFPTEFPIVREEVMLLCKIGSRNTYSQSIKWLHKCGYIIYHPSERPYMHSKIRIIQFTEKGTRQLSLFEASDAKTGTRTKEKTETHTAPQKGPYSKQKNDPCKVSKMRQKYNNKQLNNKTESKQTHSKKIINHEEKTPTMEAAANWFAQRGQTAQEARKFFYHYQAINWTLSGQPISDWQAAAAKWTENIKTKINNNPGKLHTDDNKTYTHPL